MSEKILSVSDATFVAQVLGSDIPVLVKFEAAWCGPCKAMKPAMEQIADEFGSKIKLVSLDISDSSKTAHQYGVRGVPTLMLFEKGKVMTQKVGLQTKYAIASLLEPHVAVDSVPAP